MNKTALVTGGAQRLGKAMVEFLASKGWNVIIHANHSENKAKELAVDLATRYQNQMFDIVLFDLTDWKNAQNLIGQLINKHHRIDLLINNASKYSRGSLTQTSEELLEQMTAIHYYSPLLMSKKIVETNNSAIIINMIDAAIVNSITDHSAYLLAKKSLTEFTKLAAVEWAPNVRVNAIAPGPVLPVEGKSTQAFETVVNKTPLEKPVDIKALTSTLSFLLDNPNVTGQIVFCDSGQHLV
nr:SDR family oxidoreductase [uncultured Carboxylicivirga sp.]